MTEKRHGSKQRGSGRPPLYGKRMVRRDVRLPEEWAKKLVADFGSFSAGARAAIEKYVKGR